MKSIYERFTKRTLLTILVVHLSFFGFAATYYVSNAGSDSNSGLTDALAWKTLAKVNAATFVAGDQVLFKRGDTFYGSLVISKSGSSGSPIIYGAYGTGLNPIITGFTDVSTWTNLGSNIWESTIAVSTLSDLNTVAINGVNTGMGRTPNTGYYYYQAHSGTTISSNNLTGFNWTGAECALNNVPYTVKRFNITSASGTALWLSADPGIIWDNQQFIIQNDARTLDIQNEWYYSPTTKKLRIYSTSQPTNVRVTTVDNLVTINGSYVTIDNISIIGANSKAISVGGYNYVTIQNCDIKYASASGIYGSYTSSVGLKVESCTITESNNVAIGVTSYFTSIIIRSNIITNTGIIFGASPKVWINDNAQTCTAVSMWGNSGLIELNTIQNSGYNGIRFYGNNTIVQNNYITNFCTHSHDGGGIYTWNNGNVTNTGMKILNNIVIGNSANGVSSDSDSDAGIYLDDTSNGIEISGNTVSGSDYGIFLHDAHDVVVQGNTFFNNDKGIRLYGKTSPFYMTNITVQNNTVVAKTSGQLAIHFDPLELVKPTFKSSNNCYARPINDTKTIGGYIRTPSFAGLSNTVAEWQVYSGQDANSLKSPQTITSESDLKYEYNETNTAITVSLSQPMMDMRGAKYTGAITLQPYKSVVLIKDVTAASVPGAPTSVVATAGNASASVTFAAPASNGGSTITGYTVTSSPAGGIDASAGSTLLTRTITGLTNGIAYTFTVKAINSVGASIASAPSNSVTPQAISTATTFTFSGPFSGSVNIQSANFIVTPNNPFTGTITVTPSGTGSAGVSAKVLTFINSSVAQTFTITPTVAGSITLNATNSSNLSNPTSIIYTVYATVTDPPTSDITLKYSIYSFEESSGTKVIDSKSSNDGDIINTASRVTGINGNALSFAGTGYVNLGQVYGDVKDGLTLSAWIKPTPSGDYEGVIMHGGPNTDTFSLFINHTLGTIAFKTEGTTSGKWTEIANSTIWDGSWHLLTATYNGSQKIIYLDAVPIITVSASGVINSGAGYNLLIGSGRDEIPVPSTYLYQGLIDEVRIYNYALNSSQVSSLFTTTNTLTANAFTLTGPSSGNVNNTSANFSVTPNNPFTGTITVTPTGTGSTGLLAKVLTFSNSSMAQTFTITPTVAGSITLSPSNSGTLTNPVNLTYTANAVIPAAPTSVIATSGDAGASVTFIAPTNTGGSAITGYTVTSIPAGGTDINAGSTSLTHTITGLTIGTSYTFTVKATNSAGSSVASDASNPIENIIIKQGEIIPSHFTTVWDGLNGLNHMNIIVVSANIEDIPLSVDDEIAVFSGSACVGTTKLTKSIVPGDNTTFLTILASQNDGSGNGFIDNDTIVFKIWNSKTQIELQVNGVVYRNDVSTWKTNGRYSPSSTTVVEIASYQVYTQSIQLLKGYNMISTYLSSQNPNVSAVTKTLVDQGNLIKMQDETGNSFENWGTFGGWINQLGSMQDTEGYKIQVANNCTLKVTGRRIAMPLDINLKAGWNIISFPRTDMVDAMSVVQALIDQNKLVKVQDEAGNSIENWGLFGGWKNGIGNFIPGKAYKVKMSVDAILSFQESYPKSALVLANSEPTEYYHSSVEGNGTDHMNINITGLNSIGISIGDELAAFDGEICVGTIKITEANLLTGSACLVTSSSTDDRNPNGFKVGSPIKISAWSKLSGDESIVITEVITGQMRYEKNASVLLKMKSATIATAVTNLDDAVKIDVFPNPCQDKVTVRFSDLPEANSRIEISDISGRKLISRHISGTLEEFNLESFTPGLYLVKSILGSSEFVQKLIVNK